MAEVDALLPIVTRVAGEENPLTLMTRFTKAKVLHALLRPEDAMAELDSLQPLMTKVFGPDHSATISTLETRARMTGDRA